MKTFLILIGFFLPICLTAQIDTTILTQNVDTLIFYKDSIIRYNKMAGSNIPYLAILNYTTIYVPIELSADGKIWCDFILDSHSKHLFRCDGIQKMFINVISSRSDTIKAKLHVRSSYKIFFYDGVKLDLVEMP